MNRSNPNCLACLLAVLVLSAACGGESPPPFTPAFAESDSAGVTIVSNEDRTDLPLFELGTEATLSIGSVTGEGEYQLFNVRGGTRLADGRIATVNSGSFEVRLYGADGSYLHAFGGEGEGPGEFVSPSLLGRYGQDSLLIYDSRHRRTSVVQVDDGFVRSFPVPDEAGGFPVAQGLMTGGAQVYGGGLFFSSADGGFPTGVIRNDSKYSSVDADGRPLSDFGAWPGPEMFAQVADGGFMARSLPFAKASRAGVTHDHLYIGTADSYEIRAFDPAGRLERIIRLDRGPIPVTSADVDRYEETRLEDMEDENERRDFETFLSEVPIADHLPAYGAIQVDALGFVWVQSYARPGEETRSWIVFDDLGRIVGRSETPARMSILEIGNDYMLVRTRNDFDIEYVELRSLTRPPST